MLKSIKLSQLHKYYSTLIFMCVIGLKSPFLFKIICSNFGCLLRYDLVEHYFNCETFGVQWPFQFSVDLFSKTTDLCMPLHFKQIRASQWLKWEDYIHQKLKSVPLPNFKSYQPFLGNPWDLSLFCYTYMFIKTLFS
jgi:hypothetical protein